MERVSRETEEDQKLQGRAAGNPQLPLSFSTAKENSPLRYVVGGMSLSQ